MKHGDETVTLWRTLTGALVQSVGVEPVGQFRQVRFCQTHHDLITNLVPFEGRKCRWAMKVNGDKPCVLVERWMQVVEGSQ